MENCLLSYFILNKEVKSSCDFNPYLLQEGRGVYEIVRILEKKPLFIDEHIDRFFQSAKLAGIQSGLSTQQIKNRIKVLIEINKLVTGNIRFQTLIHPQNKPLFLAWITPSSYPSKDDFKNGVCLSSLKAERKNPNAKQDKLPVREQADKLIRQQDVFEVLLINKEGFVTEGSRSNVFFVDDKKIITPPLRDVLPGVTRSKIIRLANENKIDVVERPVRFSETGHFDAVFLSGTSINVLPVNQVNDMTFTAFNPVTERMRQLYSDNITAYIKRFSWQ
jgi:branched-chain amino acid aminotransferase